MATKKETNKEANLYYNVDKLGNSSNRKSNIESIEDEFIAIQSIYPDIIKTLEAANAPSFISKDKIIKVFKIATYTETPPNFRLKIQENNNQFSYQNMHFLPVVDLILIIPDSYPDPSPPIFRLISNWLDAKQIQLISENLNSQFISSTPVLFNWTNYLIENWINDFKWIINNELIIPYSRNYKFIIDFLVDFNERKSLELMAKNYYNCQICCESKAGNDCFMLKKCEHIFCKTCIIDFLTQEIMKSKIDALDCPMANCSLGLTENQLKQILPLNVYKKYEEFSIKKAFGQSKDVDWCPKCDKISFKDNALSIHAVCSVCTFSFCVKCRQKFHPYKRCQTSKDIFGDIDLEELKKLDVKDIYQKHPLTLKLVNLLTSEAKSIIYMKNFTKPCPSCQAPILKDGGCNKVHCSKCDKSCCWLCFKIIKNYDHFSESKCILFTEESLTQLSQVYEIQPEQLYISSIIEKAKSNPDMFSKCPSCKSIVIKGSLDNLLKCDNCKSSFCYFCEEICDVKHFTDFGMTCLRNS